MRPPWRRHRRLSLRTRLTVNYAGIFLLTETLLLAAVYILMRYVPQYRTVSTDMQGVPVDSPMKPTKQGGVVSFTLESRDDVLNSLLIIFAVSLLVIGLIGVWASWLLAGRVLRPIDRITQAARAAQDGNLDERIALDGPADELKRLADTFDVMLAKLEADVHANRRFAANAAHELRTPLAATRTILQVAMANPRQHDLHELGTRLLSANTRSIDTTQALLTLATAEHADIRSEVVDIAETAAEAIEELTGEATEHSVTVHSELSPALVDADPVLLRQLVMNLLINAIRHNDVGGRVTIGTAPGEGDHHCVLTVDNTGPTVAPEQVEHLFEPFYRDRGRVGRGHGLGLSIVRAITQSHGGTITATPRPDGGLTVTVTL